MGWYNSKVVYFALGILFTILAIFIYICSTIHKLYIDQKKTCYECDYMPYTDISKSLYSGKNSKSLSVKYNEEICKFLYITSKNVSRSNCRNLKKIPYPPGFSVYYQLKVKKWGKDVTYGYIFASSDNNPQNVLLVFTGTSYSYQWRRVLNIWQTDCDKLNHYSSGMQVHSGFYRMYKSVRTIIHNILYKTLQFKTGTLYITGNSLGGGLSSLAGLDLAELHPVVYTFGSPKPGNHKFATVYNQLVPHTYRVYNTEDIYSTLIPSLSMGNLYEHVGTNIPFTLNVNTYTGNHGEAYIKHFLGSSECKNKCKEIN